MTRLLSVAWCALALVAAAPAQAAQVCAWMTETLGEDDYREVELWLEADRDVDLYYMVKGEGMKDESSRVHTPSSGTFVLSAKQPKKPWGLGATLSPPGEIDIVAELRAYPKDVFAEEPPPLIMAFTFRRAIPEGETKPPPILATRQCKTADFPKAP